MTLTDLKNSAEIKAAPVSQGVSLWSFLMNKYISKSMSKYSTLLAMTLQFTIKLCPKMFILQDLAELLLLQQTSPQVDPCRG